MKIEKIKYDNLYQHVKWVCLAKSREMSRYSMNYLHSTGRYIVCTDGHRLHAYRMPQDKQLPKGNYSVEVTDKFVMLEPAVEDVIFPEFIGVFPRHKAPKSVSLSCGEHRLANTYTSTVRAMPTESTFNLDYFTDFVEGDDTGKIRIYDNGGPVMLKSGGRTGLLMPMRM